MSDEDKGIQRVYSPGDRELTFDDIGDTVQHPRRRVEVVMYANNEYVDSVRQTHGIPAEERTKQAMEATLQERERTLQKREETLLAKEVTKQRALASPAAKALVYGLIMAALAAIKAELIWAAFAVVVFAEGVEGVKKFARWHREGRALVRKGLADKSMAADSGESTKAQAERERTGQHE